MTGRGRVEGFFIQSGLSSLLLHDVLEPSPASICDSSEALHRQAFSRGHSQKAKSHWCHFEYYSSSIFLSAYRSGPPGIGRRSHPHLTLQWIFIDNSPVIKDVLLNSLWINFLLWSQLYFYLDVIFLSRTSWTLRKYKTFFFFFSSLKQLELSQRNVNFKSQSLLKSQGMCFVVHVFYGQCFSFQKVCKAQ